MRLMPIVGWPFFAFLGSSLATAAIGCKAEPERQGSPPPKVVPPASCDGPSKVADPSNVRFFPKKTGGFCLDPKGSDRGFGKGTQQPLDAICELFDGECEIYKRHGVERVVEARYIDSKGSQATINVYLSAFDSPLSAYAMFTKRTVGDGDPGMKDAPRPIVAGGAAALGIGNAYLWRGKHMVELTFNDTAADVATLRARADEKLTPLAQALGKALPGSTELPEPAAALPTEDRIKLGVRVHLKNLMGLEGAKGGAIGYHSKGTERWRSLATAADEAQSKTRFAALAKRPEASPLTPPIGAESIQLKLKRGSSDRPATWLVARCGPRLIGVGDEWLSSTETKSSAMSEASKRKALASRCTP